MSDLVRVGRVGKPHGLDGSFFVEHASEDEARFAKGATLHVDGEPAKVVGSKRSGSRTVIRLDREPPRGAELAATLFLHGKPDQLECVVLVLAGRWQLGPRDTELGSARRFAIEADHRPATGALGRDNRRRLALDVEPRANGEARLVLAGPLDEERAVEPVRLADSANADEVSHRE